MDMNLLPFPGQQFIAQNLQAIRGGLLAIAYVDCICELHMHARYQIILSRYLIHEKPPPPPSKSTKVRQISVHKVFVHFLAIVHSVVCINNAFTLQPFFHRGKKGEKEKKRKYMHPPFPPCLMVKAKKSRFTTPRRAISAYPSFSPDQSYTHHPSSFFLLHIPIFEQAAVGQRTPHYTTSPLV